MSSDTKDPETAAPDAASVGALGRVATGTLALALSAFISIFGQFLIVPVALSVWGAASYGEWVSLTSLVTSLTLTDLGVQTYVVNRMCAHHARGDNDALLRDLHSALRVQVPFAIGILTLGALAFGLLPVGSWLGFQTISGTALFGTVFFLAAEILFWVPMGVVAGTYRAAGKLPRAALIQAIYRLGQFVVPIGVIALGSSFVWVAFSRFALSVIIFLWVLWDLGKVYDWFRLRPLGGTFEAGARMLGPGLLFLLLGLSDYVAVQGLIVVLQGQLGGAEVALFATHRTIINTARTFSGLVTSAAWPEITALDARGEKQGLSRVHRSLSKLNGLLVGVLLLGFLPVARPIYELWTMKQLSLDAVVLGILAAQTILWGFYRGGATVLSATNRQAGLVPLLMFNAVFGVGLAFLLVPSLGIRGAALGGLIGDLLVATWLVPRATTRVLGDSLWAYVREVSAMFFVGLLLPAAVGTAAYVFVPGPYLNVAACLLVGLGTALFGVRAILSEAEKALLTQAFAAVERRLRPRALPPKASG